MGRRRKPRLLENVTITGIADRGKAVGRSPEGEVVFVDGAVPGDVIDALVLRKKKGVAQGIVKATHFLSKERAVPFCKHFDDCGGCKWQNLSYEAQLQHKWTNVHSAITRIAKLDGEIVEPILGSVDQRYYRNKLEFSFCDKRYIPQVEIDSLGDIPQRPALGFHIAGAWDKVLDIDECHLQNDLSNDIRNFIKDFAIQNQLSFYNPRLHQGFMRNIIIRNTTTGDWMVIVVVSKRDQKKIDKLMHALMEQFPFITSLNYVVNDKLNDVIYDLDVVTYYGNAYIIETLKEVKYKIGPKSFFQTNSYQAERLFDTVVEFGEFQNTDNVYDLYTGIGSIALYVAHKVKHVTGIEEVEAAIIDAKENAILNQLANTTFYAGDVKDILTVDFSEQHGSPDVVITDPPRAGMHAEVIETLLQLEAPRIIYISCNPSTQARDLLLLSDKYEVTRVRPVDMFPQTHHIESVALLKFK